VAKDPQNLLLSRGPRVRLEAEMIRDGILTAAGLISVRIGGPSALILHSPPESQKSLTEARNGKRARVRTGTGAGCTRSANGRLRMQCLRHSTRQFGDVCIAQREVSDTPLQALTLLNDVVITEAAQALGRRMTERTGTLGEKMEFLFRSCFTRPPSADGTRRARWNFPSGEKREAGRANSKATLWPEKAKVTSMNVRRGQLWDVRCYDLDEAVTKG